MASYRFIEHTADVVIEAEGYSLEEAFEQAALAMYEVMTDTSLISFIEEKCIETDGFDLENLLYKWLESLLILTDSKGLIFGKFKVNYIEKRGGTYLLNGCAYGEKLDRSRHASKTVVKAVTYHQMSICEEQGVWKIRYTLDI